MDGVLSGRADELLPPRWIAFIAPIELSTAMDSFRQVTPAITVHQLPAENDNARDQWINYLTDYRFRYQAGYDKVAVTRRRGLTFKEVAASCDTVSQFSFVFAIIIPIIHLALVIWHKFINHIPNLEDTQRVLFMVAIALVVVAAATRAIASGFTVHAERAHWRRYELRCREFCEELDNALAKKQWRRWIDAFRRFELMTMVELQEYLEMKSTSRFLFES